MSPASTVAGTAAASTDAHPAPAAPPTTDPALSAATLAALSSLVPSLPRDGERARSAPLSGSADALAIAQLAVALAPNRRMIAVLAADALAAQRLVEEITWF